MATVNSEGNSQTQQEQDPICFQYKRVCLWDVNEVTLWVKGLSDCLSRHIPQFEAHGISGSDLLKLSQQQLEYLKVIEVGHQELLLEAIELLASVDNARSRQSTMSLASTLSKKTSQLYKAATFFQKHTTEDNDFLMCIEVGATVLKAAKFLIGWLDRFPTVLIEDYTIFRSQLLNYCLFLSESLDDNEPSLKDVTDTCSSILNLTYGLMSPELFAKPDSVLLADVTLVPHSVKGLGFSIQRSRRGALVICHIEDDSPAYNSQKMYEGAELIQINGQNVVSWEVKHVVKSLKASGYEVTLTLRISNCKYSSKQIMESASRKKFQTMINRKRGVHLTLERVPSSPASLGASSSKGEAKCNELVTRTYSIENEKSMSLQKCETDILRTHSCDDVSGLASIDTTHQAPLAYKTEIIGGVVHRITMQ